MNQLYAPPALPEILGDDGFRAAEPADRIRVLRKWKSDTVAYGRAAIPGWSKEHEQQIDDYLPDREGVIGRISELSSGVWDSLVNQAPSDFAAIIQGTDVPLAGADTWAERLKTEQIQDRQRRPQSLQTLAGEKFGEALATGPSSMVTSAVTGLGGAAAGTAAGGAAGSALPGIGNVAGAAAGAAIGAGTLSGAAFYRIAANNFLTQIRDNLARQGATITNDQWEGIKSELDSETTKYGLWEAGPEAISQAFSAGLFNGAIAKAIGKIPGLDKFVKTSLGGIGQKIADNAMVQTAGKYGGKLALKGATEIGEELTTETATQLGQGTIEARNKLREKAPTLGEAFQEVAGPTIVGAVLQGGTFAGAQKLHERFSTQPEADTRQPSAPPPPQAGEHAPPLPPTPAPPAPVGRQASVIAAQLDADARATQARRDAEVRETLRRDAEEQDRTDKRGRFDERIAAAADVMRRPAATFSEVTGALESVTFYADDNSLGLDLTQRQTAQRAKAALAQRQAALQPAEDARANEEYRARVAQEKEAAATKKAAVKADKARVAAIETTGRDPQTGNILDLTKLPAAELHSLDLSAERNQFLDDGTQLTEEHIAAELERRGRAEERSAALTQDRGDDLLKTLERVKLPTTDPALQAELSLLTREGMTPRQRMQFTSTSAPTLDRTAETLRERGFSTIKTPADVISAVERALAGEQVFPDWAGTEAHADQGQVDFATGANPAAPANPHSALFRNDNGGLEIRRYPTAADATKVALDRELVTDPQEQTDDSADQTDFATGESPTPKTENLTGITQPAPSNAEMGRLAQELKAAGQEGGLSRAGTIRAITQIAKENGWRDWPHTQTPEDYHLLIDGLRERLKLPPRPGRAPAGGQALLDLARNSNQTGPTSPRLNAANLKREIAALRNVSPKLAAVVKIQIGDIQRALDARNYVGEIPADAKAAVHRLESQQTLIVLAARAYLDRAKGAALLTHEVAHLFWDTLPVQTQQALLEIRRHEIATKSGPLYRGRQLIEQMAFVEEDSERGHKEWFAERTARLNESWTKGKMDLSEQSILRRVAFQLREMLRRLWARFARAEGIDPTSKLFVDDFRAFVGSGASAEVGRRAGADFAQSLLSLDTPLGIDLPNEIRNLQPRWQDKILHFDSQLDKALYYAGGENTATREKVVAHLADETGLTAGQIAALARILRTKLRALTPSAASPGTLQVPAQMRQDVADLTGTEFATGATPAAIPPWPADFPNVTVMTTVNNLYDQGGFKAAKAGNLKAAQDVVFTTARETKMRALAQRHPQAILVPVHAQEATGRNRLPQAFADAIADLTGLEVGLGIVQINRAHRTGGGQDYRMAIRAKFDGPVQAGREYIIVDDVVTMGGSIAELRAHIESHGGKVVDIATLAAAQFSAKLALSPKTRLALEQKYDSKQLSEWLAQQGFYRGEIGALTEAEARWLLRAQSLDAAGNRIAAARPEGRAPGEHGGLREDAGTVDFATGAAPEGDLPMGMTPEDAPAPNQPAPPRKPDRQTSLIAEWRYAKELRDKGIKAGNHAAEEEGQRQVSRLKRLLDDEFPDWEAQAYLPAEGSAKAGDKATNGSRVQPPVPPSEPGAADLSDAEASPFAEPPPEMPIRPATIANLFGHTDAKPTFLERSWDKVRDFVVGIKGAVPELPTFGGASWNKSDSFIRDHGPNFYDGIKALNRKLSGANDGIQSNAESDVAKITGPLLAAGGEFNADDYARLQRRQEQSRRAAAAGQTLPPGVALEITALQSKLESHPYILFNETIVYLDLNWRHNNLKDSKGKPIALPGGINGNEIAAELARLDVKIGASDHATAIATAIEQHKALVARVAADLKQRELMAADALDNPFYFPHLTLETTRGGQTEQREMRPARVKADTEADFRGYLIDPVGSTKAIQTDYVRAMYYHLVQVGAHNTKADAIAQHARPYDVMKEVERRAKELASKWGRSVSWETAFHLEYAPRGYVLYGSDRDAYSSITLDRDRLAYRLGIALTSDDLRTQLNQLEGRGIKLLPDDLKETLMQGQRETWIVPARVAEALRGIATRADRQDDAMATALKACVGTWKAWKLFMPWNHVRYEYGNLVADMEKVFSTDPGMIRQMYPAAKELRAFWLGGEPGPDLAAAVKESVINTITAGEMHALQRQPNFRAFEPWSERLKNETKAFLSAPLANAPRIFGFNGPLGRTNSVEESAFREAIFRYAKFKADLAKLRAGARPAYAGAYWRDIDAMQDSYPGAADMNVRKAAQISKSTFGDYGDLSVTGQALRDKLAPFYSWQEVNFKYHANLARNLRDMVHADELIRAEAPAGGAAAGTQAAAVAAAGYSARVAGGVALRLAMPYLGMALWNTWGGAAMGLWDDDDDLEGLLSEEDKRRAHIILGLSKNDAPDIPGIERSTLRDGRKIEVVYANTAFLDVMKWFTGPKFTQNMAGWLSGRTDFPTAFSAWRDSIIPDTINTAAGSLGPVVKIPYAIMSGKATFPDVFDQRTIPGYAMAQHIIGQMTDDFTADMILRVADANKPVREVLNTALPKEWEIKGDSYYATKSFGDWAKQLILQVRQRDPEAWAFYAIKDKAATFAEQATGQKRDSDFDAPDQQVLRNFRRAIYRGDLEKATQFYHSLLDYGYTADRFADSIRAQDPLSVLPKTNGLRQAFVNSLTPPDREMLTRAETYYDRINSSRGRERQLFPMKNWGARGLQRYQEAPRDEQLAAMMERAGSRTEQEQMQRADRSIRESLRKK